MVKFPGGTVYDDPQAEPPSSELLKGTLVEDKDSKWVTWQGIGLKRNDYYTWGVCLPKTRDMAFAVSIWDFLSKKANS